MSCSCLFSDLSKGHILAKSLHNIDSENTKYLLSSFHWPKVVFGSEIHVHCCDEVVSKQIISHLLKFTFRTSDFNWNLTQKIVSKWKLDDERGNTIILPGLN